MFSASILIVHTKVPMIVVCDRYAMWTCNRLYYYVASASFVCSRFYRPEHVFFFKVSAEKKFKLTERIARKVYVLYFLGILQHWNAQWRHVLWWKRPFYVRVVLICLKITYIPSNVQGACWRTVTLLRSNHEGHKQHSIVPDRLPAQFRVKKRLPWWLALYISPMVVQACRRHVVTLI